ncbi:MAG TPA: hypothetical protein VFI02_02090 [Armatimonadota bacterium]|nr:hypothetical protein [Armatimonadota bacterium]
MNAMRLLAWARFVDAVKETWLLRSLNRLARRSDSWVNFRDLGGDDDG